MDCESEGRNVIFPQRSTYIQKRDVRHPDKISNNQKKEKRKKASRHKQQKEQISRIKTALS